MAPMMVLFLAAGSCTGSDTAATPDDPGGGESSPGVSEGDPRLRACIEGAGYDYEEVYPPWSSPSPPPEDSVFADPAFWQVLEGCLVEAGLGEPFDQERIARENRETLKYVACMRDRGWELPEPTPWEGPEHPGLLDEPISVPEDPEAADQYYRDSADCGFPFYDENDNLLPLDGSKGVS